jgi:DNA-binding SARP family transcriptional activator/predicted ATPase
MSLEINTLGRFQLCVDGQDVTTDLDASRIFLLIYLADTGQAQPRDHLAELLWPERPHGRARSNLRTLLTRLRPLLANYLQATPERVALHPTALIRFDAHLFATQIALAQNAQPAKARQALATALRYYQGDFLATDIGGWNEEMESWLTTRRLALHGQAVQALRHLLNDWCHDNLPEAIAYARQLRDLEPLDEAACRQLMTLLAQQGQRDEALWHYQRYQQALREVWATVTPSEELVMLAAKIRLGMTIHAAGEAAHEQAATHQSMGQLPPQPTKGASNAVAPSLPAPTANHTATIAETPPLFRPFPTPLKPLIGRTQEQAQLIQWLNLGYRLIAVTGLGGIGKSHFVQTVVAAEQTRWRAGALYVALPELGVVAEASRRMPNEQQQAQSAILLLCQTLATALELPLQSSLGYTDQITQTLAPYVGCLVLDNFERVLPAAPFLQTLLARAGGLTVIVCSRQPVRLTAQAQIALSGLPLQAPARKGATANVTQRAAAEQGGGMAEELLALNLIRQYPGFQLHEADQPLLRDICQAVHGLPLALEMVPALVRYLPLHEVATQLRAAPLTLTADFADLPAQHRSLYTLMDATFMATAQPMQEALLCLAVFAGSFSVEAARCVINPNQLEALRAQQWLETVDGSLFTLHPLVAAFARSLCVDQKWAMIYAQARRAHAGYYAKLVGGHHFFQNPHYTAGTIWLRQHFAEITTACQTFLAETSEEAVPLLHVIAMYGHHFGDQQTVHHWLRQGLDKLPTTLPARFRLLLDYVACTTELRNVAAANTALVEAHIYAAEQDDQAALLALYERLAWAAHIDYAADSPQRRLEGRHYFSQGLALAETMGDQSQVVNMLAHRAFFACWDPAGYPQAQADLQQALTIAHQLGQPGVLGIVYKILTYVEFVAGHLALAQRYGERAMQLLAAEGGMLMTLGWLYMERSQIALAQRDTPVALHYLTLAGEIFRPVAYEAGLTQCHTLLGIVAFLEENPDEAERYWLRAYRAVQQMTQQDKLTVTLTLGIGVTQLIQGDPMLGAQLVAAARVQYEEKAFHWVLPEQRLMTYLIERAETEQEALALPVVVAIDAQVATQVLMLLAGTN